MLTTDQIETLQEIANIGMGQAGASIAKVLEQFVVLSIPRIVFLQPDKLADELTRTAGEGHASAVRQAFHSEMCGEAIVIFGEQRCNDLADLMGHEEKPSRAAEMELLLEMTNILVGACLSGITKQLEAEIRFSAPSLLADRVPIAELFNISNVSWQNALLVEVNFRLEQRSFACHLIMLMAEEEIRALTTSLDRFLEKL